MTSIDTTKNIYASRNADGSVWRDEDRAMAHEHWGPFTSVMDARRELVERMRSEAAWLTLHANGETALNRAESIRRYAGIFEATPSIESIEVAGLVWKVSNWAY